MQHDVMTASPQAKTILAVDDSAGHLKLLELILGAHRFHVESAADGHEALTKLQSLTPDLMIFDVEMPFMDGFELCRRVRRVRRLRDVPVLVMTSSMRDDLEERARSAGAGKILHKPVRGQNLGRVVSEMLRESHAGRPI